MKMMMTILWTLSWPGLRFVEYFAGCHGNVHVHIRQRLRDKKLNQRRKKQSDN